MWFDAMSKRMLDAYESEHPQSRLGQRNSNQHFEQRFPEEVYFLVCQCIAHTGGWLNMHAQVEQISSHCI